MRDAVLGTKWALQNSIAQFGMKEGVQTDDDRQQNTAGQPQVVLLPEEHLAFSHGPEDSRLNWQTISRRKMFDLGDMNDGNAFTAEPSHHRIDHSCRRRCLKVEAGCEHPFSNACTHRN